MDPQNTTLQFLNDAASHFPSAISLAAGQPTECFLDRLNLPALMGTFFRHQAGTAALGLEAKSICTSILRYGPTAGLIRGLISQQLAIDENIAADPETMLMTSGCQEALSLCLPALCTEPNDVLLVCNPTYAGAICAAQMNRIEVRSIATYPVDLAEGLKETLENIRRTGRRVRALYLIPTFDNPTGRVLTEIQRRQILALCVENGVVILEDNPYGMFQFEDRAVPPLAALDCHGCVIYLTTFSKTLAPALRVGAIALPKTLFGDRLACQSLYRRLIERKSCLTINTSQIGQAVVGGVLIEQECSLQNWVRPACNLYHANRDAMLEELNAAFSDRSPIHWNRPNGGFFLSVTLPFVFDVEAALGCARDFGVLAAPMNLFSLDESQNNKLRLSFSNGSSEMIRTGIRRLAQYIRSRLILSSCPGRAQCEAQETHCEARPCLAQNTLCQIKEATSC
jgi:(S)-3,5-dihydroxyphenylglycine transaminase